MTTSTCVAAANGHWFDILTGPGGVDPALLDGRPRACPICGTGTNRFTFDNKDDRGTWICRQCPARPGKQAGAGDGMDLFLAVTKWDFKRAAEEIERHLGLPLQTASNDHRPAFPSEVLTRRQASPPPPAALPASPQGSIELLRLPEVPSDVVRIDIHGPGVKIKEVDYAIEATYWYSETQKTDRLMPLDGTKKRFCPAHLSGDRWMPSQGSSPWPLYRQLEALAAAKVNPGRWILETEGEKAAEIAREGGLVAISQPGHNHTIEKSSARYADLTGPDVAGILYLADQDDEGVKRAQGALEAAAAVGLQLVVLPASEVWPSLPKGGSIDDAIGTPAQRVAAIEKEASLIETNEWAEIWAEWQAAMGVVTQVQQVVAAAVAVPDAIQRHQQQAAFQRDRSSKPKTKNERKEPRHLSHTKAMACFDRCVVVQAQRERNSLRRRARLLKAAKDLGLATFINRQEISQKVLEAKARSGGEGFKPLTAADRAAMPKPVVRWLVRGLIPAGDMTIIGGRPKVGKTRVAVAIVAAMLRGEPFLEFSAPASSPPVLLVTDDQSAGDTADMLTALDLWTHPRLVTSEHFRLTEPDLDALLEVIKANPGALVVLDSLRSIGRALQHGENDPEIGATLYDLKQSVIDAGGTLLLIHHCNKAADLVGVEALSGHSAISGAANTVITLHHCPNDKGQPDKINPQRRLFSEGRSGEGCDLVIDRAASGSFRQVSTFEHWQQQLSEAKKNQKLERLTELQQQALDALNDSGEWMTRRKLCEELELPWGDKGQSKEAKNLAKTLTRLLELKAIESSNAGRETTYRSHGTQNDWGSSRSTSPANGSGDSGDWGSSGDLGDQGIRRLSPRSPRSPLNPLEGINETDCEDRLIPLIPLIPQQHTPHRQENEQRIRDLGHSTDLTDWSDDDVADLLQSLEQAHSRRSGGLGASAQRAA